LEVFHDVTTFFARRIDGSFRSQSQSPHRSFRGNSLTVACDPLADALSRGGEVTLLKSFLTHFKREEGQTMAEYGVVLAVITLGVVVALGFLSGAITGALQRVTGILG
jgi:Flp pilus assembly pilin Flp